MFVSLLLRFWKEIVGVLLIFLLLYITYSKGHANAELEYNAKLAEYSTSIDKRIEVIEKASNTLILEAVEARKIRKKEFESLANLIKAKPMFVVSGTECKPSPDLIEVYNKAAQR